MKKWLKIPTPQKQILLLVIISVGLMFAFTNCAKPPEAGTPIVETTPTPNPVTEDQKIDAWNAPVGNLVQGATLYDGWTDLRVLPDPVNIPGGWTDSPAISYDGMSLYFAYGRFEFADIVDGISTTNMTGARRPGMIGDDMKNFKASLTKSGWVVNYMSSPFNNSDITLPESSLSPNVSENLIIWTRWDRATYKASLYFSYKNADGSWTAAQMLPSPINNPNCSNDNGFVVGDVSTGVDIYWESDRTDLACSSGGAKKHIYHSYFNSTTGIFSAAELLPGVNSTQAGDEDQQFSISPDKKHVYWTVTRSNFYGLYTADLVGTAYMNARPIVAPNYVSPFTGKLGFLGEINVSETPQGWLAYFACGIATKETGVSHGQHIWMCRMKKPKTADTTAAKKINSAGWSDSPYISRDGQRLYFMYSRWDFSKIILGTGQPELKGPDRPGLNKSANSWDESDIYVSTKNSDGTWSEPVNLGLNGAYGDASGMEYNNGNSFIWLHGNGTGNNIVMATKNANGTWGSIVDPGVGINKVGNIQDNPFISEDGNNMWFVSDRSGGVGGKDNWYSAKSGGVWSAPVNLGIVFNSSGDEDQPWIPNGGASTDVYWNSPVGLKHCVSNGSGCTGTPDIMTFSGCDAAAEISMPDDGQTAYFGCGSFSTGRVKIMYSRKQSDGSWGPATPVD